MTHARLVRTRPPCIVDLDLPLPHGITALVGSAAAEMTLALEMIAGFTRPDSGRILIDDAIVFDAAARVDLPARRRRCGYVPSGESLFPQMTVRQNLMFAAAFWARLERHKRVAEMLERFELAASLDQHPHELPPALRLRAEIARALIAEPKLLLLDEQAGRGIGESLLRLMSAAFTGPILMVTADLDLCYSSAACVALCDGGRIIQRGAARHTLENPESPAAARLLGIDNLFSATIAALDPGRNLSRLECESFVLQAPYLKGHFKGDRVSVGIRSEDVRVHAGELEPEVNFLPAVLQRVVEHPRAVHLEFAGGISARLSREQFEREKDNRSWQVELPPAALRIF
jgi:molybdate transport system ATP-binding protein